MGKSDVLDAMRALPQTGPTDVLRTLVVADVRRQIDAVEGLSTDERAVLLRDVLEGPEVREALGSHVDATAVLHAAFGLGARGTTRRI